MTSRPESTVDDTTPRQPITELGPEVVERIAAGEVIERPASVVRELIENALDAGATAIRVDLREGGLRLVRVVDDGCGIPADELPLAVAPHATSKLRDLSDLQRIQTLGFRGEALASVAAVAELHVTTAGDESGLAATLTIRGGQPVGRGLCARPRGTTVEVRELFHNVPARRATLRGPQGESTRALAVVRAYALAHPHVRFTAIADGAVAFQTPATTTAAAAGAMYGSDVARTLLTIGPLDLDGVTLSGWIAPRAFNQPDRGHVLLAINGRPVSNRALLTAIEAGYRPLLRKGRHPIAVITLRVDPAHVDANVHPGKAEVLLQMERAIAPVLRDALRTALGNAPALVAPPIPGARLAYGAPRQSMLPTARRRGRPRIGEPHARYSSAFPHDGTPSASGPLPELHALGQLDDALIVAHSDEGHLYLVDQHRAHERLLYEALRRTQHAVLPRQLLDISGDCETAPDYTGSQLLLEPLVVELHPRQAAILSTRLDQLAAMGLVCEPFGGVTFLLRALPTLPGAAESPATFAEALAEDAAVDSDDWRDHLCIALACRSALRRGQPLALAQQQSLLADLHGAEVSAFCPHGSPILLRYTQSFLARAFEW